MRGKKAIYSAIFLDAESQQKLKAVAHLEKVFCHHLTLAFKPSSSHVEALPMGEEVSLEVVCFGDDGRAQAAGCHIRGEVIDFCSNEKPHITISCAEGVSPVHSNELVFDQFVEPYGRLQLKGRVGIFTGVDQFDFEGTIYEER